MPRRQLRSTLFPYTTLFRSRGAAGRERRAAAVPERGIRRRLRSWRDPVHGRPRAADSRVSPRVEARSEEHTSELQSLAYLVCRLLLEKKKRCVSYQVNEHGT